MKQVRNLNYRLAAVALAAVAVLAVIFGGAPSLAKPPSVFSGIVRHVSLNNIKVYDPRSRKTMGFAIAPKFHNIFKKGSKTTQLSTIAAGQYVKVYYDRALLGAARARSIYLIDKSEMPFYRQ